jgi:formylglycine-generating enzyme required for sulfatase activity
VAKTEKLKVFLSYSRRDSSDFADELVEGLELAGFAPFLDRHDIAAGEDWEARLGGLIQEADTVVFIVSPEAVKSERCAWEVDKSLALSKRLLPVITKPVPNADIPEKLRRRQFVDFTKVPSITRPLRELSDALRRDLEWIREHTRLGELATRWQSRSRPDSLLLRGDELDAAKAWVTARKPEAPEITDIQHAFISESEQAETARIIQSRTIRRRMRWAQALVGTLAAIIALALVAYWNEQSLKRDYHWFAYVRGHVLTAQHERILKPGETFSECVRTDGDYSKYCPEMVVVPAGKFMMGSSKDEDGRDADEVPMHEVTIARPFAVSKFEVTFDQWDVCVQTRGCTLPGAGASSWGRGKQPAINLSWDDAQQYVKWFSEQTGQRYRLLSEAEWEYATRAGTNTPYSFDGNQSALGEYAWYTDNADERTHPVGEKKPNAFGLYDMHGNVTEWLEDCYHDSYEGAPTDGSVWTGSDCIRHVVRGGSWVNNPAVLRSAYRYEFTFDFRDNFLGFRVGRTLLPP